MTGYSPVYWTGVGQKVWLDGKVIGHIELAGDQGPLEDWLGFLPTIEGAVERGTKTQCRAAVIREHQHPTIPRTLT